MLKSETILKCESILEVLGDTNLLESQYKIGTNTRNFNDGDCFLAIKGEKFDGFQFVDQVLEKTNLIILEHSEENKKKVETLKEANPNKVFILVGNSIVYTQELASLHVLDWFKKPGREIIAISGSNGKTTTKEMLWHILHSINPNNVIKTERNNNNHLGVPFTLFQISEETDYAVVEYGSNHPGEMKTICDCSHPTMGITTNIGDTHMEFFRDLQEVFNEEALILKYISKSRFGKKLFFKNLDDELLKSLEDKSVIKTFSLKSDADFKYLFNRDESTIKVNETKLKNSNILGEHNFLNLANAFAIAIQIYPNKKEEIINACGSFLPTGNRSQWVDWNNSRLFLDAYNANPSSMKLAATEFYETYKSKVSGESRCLLVVGDMNELGDEASRYHEELGQFLSKLERSDVIYLGRYKEYFENGYKGNLLISRMEASLSTEELEQVKNYSWIFVKASRSLQLESVLDIKESTT